MGRYFLCAFFDLKCVLSAKSGNATNIVEKAKLVIMTHGAVVEAMKAFKITSRYLFLCASLKNRKEYSLILRV